MLTVEQTSRVEDPKIAQPVKPLSALEVEIIDLFVQFSRILGQPKSVAEIYGLLFVSPRPLSMEELMERLKISKGSTSQGLRFLRTLGAVKQVYIPGQRASHFESVAELRNLASRFVRDQFVPHLDNGQARLGRIAEMVKELPPEQRARINGRVKMLQSWGRNGRRFLPLLVKILGK